MNKIKVIELFGGIGAPRKALENVAQELGFDIKSIDYVEICPKAVESYNALFEHLKEPESVIGYNLKPDILVHGSPCQTFSMASNGIKQLDVADNLNDYLERIKNGTNVKSDLFWETLRIIDNFGQWKPNVVIWENVPSVLNKNNISSFNAYIETMEEMGYTNSYEILDATDFGIPQGRKRLFVVSKLNGTSFNFDNLEKKLMRKLTDFLETNVDDYYTIGQPSMLKAIEDNKMKILDLNNDKEYVSTITTKQWRWNVSVVPISDTQYRILTPLECWRLMGFSDNDYYNVSQVSKRNDLYMQAGNSIVVDVMESIFKELLKGE